MSVDGPAAGHERMKTSADPSGMRILGTLNNCAGGMTPWGTYLTAEENFHGYFWSDLCAHGRQGARRVWAALRPRAMSATACRDCGRPGASSSTVSMSTRSRTSRTASAGSSRSIRPTPSSVPVKHTALGRFRHEGAECLVNKDGRIVVYCGDDARFDYVYRFVSDGRYDAGDRKANMTLLSAGTLSVAKFHDDGSVEWLPLDLRPTLADAGLRLQFPGGRGDRRAARRRPSWRDPHGPARGRAAEPGQWPGLCDPDQQQGSRRQARGCRQSAGRERVRPHHRDDPARRRPCCR